MVTNKRELPAKEAAVFRNLLVIINAIEYGARHLLIQDYRKIMNFVNIKKV